jgi:hypothetical protein
LRVRRSALARPDMSSLLEDEMLLIRQIHDDKVGCPSLGPSEDGNVLDGTATSARATRSDE